MKDWNITKGNYIYTLKHRCPNQVKAFEDRGGHFCSINKDGKWFCGLCGVIAPEEIGFCAELAGCTPLHHYSPTTGGSAGPP